MDSYACTKRITDEGIIAIIRADSPDKVLDIAQALLNGGVKILEVTMTVPRALDVIKELTLQHHKGDALIGAGSILDSEMGGAALSAGAGFLVGPTLNINISKLCNRYRIMYIPGAMTPTEIMTAMEAGANVIKVFPGNVLGPDFIKAIKGPLPQARLIPTGGVNLENVGTWIESGALAVGVGGELTQRAETGDFDRVAGTARSFVEKVRAAKETLRKEGKE